MGRMPREPLLIACHTHTYGRHGALAAICNVRRAGIGWVELPIRTAGYKSRHGDEPLIDSSATPLQVAKVRRFLQQEGVGVASCTCMAGNPLLPANVALARRKLEIAAELGARVVIVDGGMANGDDERTLIVKHLRELGDHAARLGLTVCLETFRGLCANHRWMKHVLAELDHPRLRANFDPGNLLYYNEAMCVEVALAKICHLVKHVRLKDSMGLLGQWHFPALGAGGAVDFLRIYQIMRDCGFKGPFSIAIEGVEGEPEPTLEECHQRLEQSLRYLQSLGYFDQVARGLPRGGP